MLYRVITRGFTSLAIEQSRGYSKRYAVRVARKKAREGHYVEIQICYFFSVDGEEEWVIWEEEWETIWNSRSGWIDGWI